MCRTPRTYLLILAALALVALAAACGSDPTATPTATSQPAAIATAGPAAPTSTSATTADPTPTVAATLDPTPTPTPESADGPGVFLANGCESCPTITTPTPAATPESTPTAILTLELTATSVAPTPTPPPLPDGPTAIELGPGKLGLFPSRDATLNEDPEGVFGNSRGRTIFVGNTNRPEIRRTLIAFDVAGVIPAGATITEATLSLSMTRSQASETSIALHRVTGEWTEGLSAGFAQGGRGDIAVEGDPTWVHRTFETARWATPGGDFDATASATAAVGALGRYEWLSNDATVADVQVWLDDPGSDHGWLLMGDETVRQTAKQFASRESGDPAARPMLTVTFTAGG